MSIRETILGKRNGQTAYEKLKNNWQQNKRQENWQQQFQKAYNPLKLNLNDIFELGSVDPKPFRVKKLFWYETPSQQPDYCRYELHPMEEEGSSPYLLEVMPEGTQKLLIYSHFQLVDEFEMDERLIQIIEEEETLDHTRPQKSGSDLEITYDKDFTTAATLHTFQDQNYDFEEIYCVNYFAQLEKEVFLTVEISEIKQWMSFFEGEKLRSIEISPNLT